jgi:hypothetical protein
MWIWAKISLSSLAKTISLPQSKSKNGTPFTKDGANGWAKLLPLTIGIRQEEIMNAKIYLPEFTFEGVVVKGVDEREANQRIGEVSFICDGQSEVAVLEIDSCRRVSKNIENSISKICIPAGSRVEFKVKKHLENQGKAYNLQII